MRIAEIADSIGAVLRGDGEIAISRVDSLSGARADSLVFAEDAGVLEQAMRSAAAAVVVSQSLAELAGESKPLLVMKQPKLGFARAAHLLRRSDAATGVHASAILEADVTLEEGVTVGAYAVVGQGAYIGASSSIGAGAVIGRDVKIGAGCRIYPRVVVYAGVELGNRVIAHAGAVLGADGFGYVRDGETGEYLQFPQQGRLIIEDDVEIGANTTIDRGALDETRIGAGVKIDNLVHLGHNVSVGKNVVIAAQTGVSGSSTIRDGAVVAGQVGIADHVEIGEGVILGAQCGVPSHKVVRGPGMLFWGTPARPIKDYLKELATLARLSRRSANKS